MNYCRHYLFVGKSSEIRAPNKGLSVKIMIAYVLNELNLCKKHKPWMNIPLFAMIKNVFIHRQRKFQW